MSERQTASTTIEILLVEDSPADARLLMETLKDGGFPYRMSVTTDGEEALAYLRHESRFQNSARPDLIILDLNLPRKDGCQLLREIREDSALRAIPVVVLTTSDSHGDMIACRDLHVNSYIVKPVRFDKYADIVRSIESHWMSVAALRMHL